MSLQLRPLLSTVTAGTSTAGAPLHLEGIIIGGLADLKSELQEVLEPRLRQRVLMLVDVSHSGENGLSEAISRSASHLEGIRYLAERDSIQRFFDVIARDPDMAVYGRAATLAALRAGMLTQLFLCEKSVSVNTTRTTTATTTTTTTTTTTAVVVPSSSSSSTTCEDRDGMHICGLVEDLQATTLEGETGDEMLESLFQLARETNADVSVVSMATPEAQQLYTGFDGFGGLLRFRGAMDALGGTVESDDDDNDDLDMSAYEEEYC